MIASRFAHVLERLARAPAPPPGMELLRYPQGGEEMLLCAFSLRPGTAAEGLTQAEREVVALLLEGRSNADIARTRGTSARTVANQIQSVFRKLGVGSRAELVATSAMWRADAPKRR